MFKWKCNSIFFTKFIYLNKYITIRDQSEGAFQSAISVLKIDLNVGEILCTCRLVITDHMLSPLDVAMYVSGDKTAYTHKGASKSFENTIHTK